MKVLELRCAHDHRFEGWFASEDEFASQRTNSRIACPMCGDTAIDKLPSAPHLNLVGAPAAAAVSAVKPAAQDVQALWLQAMRQLMARTEDVGSRFAEEARRIHYGEAQERGIRGQASREETEALADEGIEVLRLPVPDALEGPLQ